MILLGLAVITPVAAAPDKERVLRIYAARTVVDPGLIDYLVRQFNRLHPEIKVRIQAAGALGVLEQGRLGKADLLITHYPPEEERFLKLGFGTVRIQFMYSQYALFGPPKDPLGLGKMTEFSDVFHRLKEEEVEMLVSSPRSGTYRKLEELWASAGINPDWIGYENTGASVMATMKQAAEVNAYTFADMGFYFANQKLFSGILQPLYRDDIALRNDISAIVVNRRNITDVREDPAERFLEFLVSRGGQDAITDFSINTFGTAVYVPVAHNDKTIIGRKLRAQITREQRNRNIWLGFSILLLVLIIVTVILFQRTRRLEKKHWEKDRQLILAEQQRMVAEKSDEVKKMFISRMSHELRTPLNAIMGYVQVMQADPKDVDLVQSSLNEIMAASTHQLDLINELLDLSQIEAGKLAFNLEQVDLAMVIRECIQLNRPLAGKRNIVLESRMETDPMMIEADPKRLRQILLNLLSNAIKYNRERGMVTVVAYQQPDKRVRVEVVDTGDGISQEDIALLFQPFERLSEDKAGSSGTGLGLVITKNLVEMMKGTIGIESEPGKGAVFWFEMPRSQHSAV